MIVFVIRVDRTFNIKIFMCRLLAKNGNYPKTSNLAMFIRIDLWLSECTKKILAKKKSDQLTRIQQRPSDG